MSVNKGLFSSNNPTYETPKGFKNYTPFPIVVSIYKLK